MCSSDLELCTLSFSLSSALIGRAFRQKSAAVWARRLLKMPFVPMACFAVLFLTVSLSPVHSFAFAAFSKN